MQNITIIPGSFKPPHKGHLSLIENIIKKGNNSKIIIIISNKPRTFDSRFQYYEKKTKDELQKALIDYYPNMQDYILSLSKDKILKLIKDLINYSLNKSMNNSNLINKLKINKKNKLKIVNSKQSLKIWNIYLKYLKEKYKNKKKFPKIIFKISETNNIIKETIKTILKCFKENKYNKIILMKSEKNKDNSRFDFILKSYHKYIDIQLFPNIKNINATHMRNSILRNNKINFYKYLPSDLNESDKIKIWKLLNYSY
jgi:cytidyltransferase-like protein